MIIFTPFILLLLHEIFFHLTITSYCMAFVHCSIPFLNTQNINDLHMSLPSPKGRLTDICLEKRQSFDFEQLVLCIHMSMSSLKARRTDICLEKHHSFHLSSWHCVKSKIYRSKSISYLHLLALSYMKQLCLFMKMSFYDTSSSTGRLLLYPFRRFLAFS